MIKQGKSKDTAVLRTLINTQAQNFATKRLLKDLNIIEKESISTMGVSARLLEHDLFIWHANIRGPVGDPYEGGIFHFELLTPESYPHQPPKINLFTELLHQNVFGIQICLDLLQPRKPEDKDKYAYTIQSILLQLSAFLFEEQITEKKEKQHAQIKKAVQAANNFKCTTKNCKHGGKLSLWPQFNNKESEEQQFINKQTEQELLEQQFICFHTKLSYRKPQSPQFDDETKMKQESCLGILLDVSKVPRTGSIKQAVPSLDYVSIQTFLNESLKWDSLNLTYTHWLPLYFGKTDNKKRVLHLLQRSLSMIMTNNTKRFKPEFVLEVFPNITQSIVHAMMAEKTHASIRCLRVLAQVHALWLLQIPELADEKLDGAISATKRVEITFKQQSTSFQMGCFQYIYLTYVVQTLKTQKEILERFDKNYCLLTTGIENGIQEKVFEAFKRVVNYEAFYEFNGQEKKSIEELNQLLKQAVKNSKEKKYHGTVKEMNQLPSAIEQVKQFKKKNSNLQDFYVITKEELDKKQFKYNIEAKQNIDWKQELIKRWDWIEELLKLNPELNATELAQQANMRTLNGFGLKPDDRLYNKIETLRNQYHKVQYQTDFPQHNWQQLYMKLDFEQFLIQFDQYCFIRILYITAALEQFTKLIRLTLTGLDQSGSIIFPKKAAKSFCKGLNNLSKQQNNLQFLEIIKLGFSGNQIEITESIFGVLTLFANQLRSLTIENTDLLTLSNAAKTVGAIITSFRHLEFLNLKGSIRNANIAKEITDGLMRAKQLVTVDLSQIIQQQKRDQHQQFII
ncbi:unnamed protein product [Paramecium sonneborni]|uniref:UBC core domain-containing protein n=1 Tax=Paramecium sonneborni TaxID=65129 RepID=A0A8S1NAV0_9CILI|nr:unnamed protein product [Paramecium sonneborni]